MRRTFEKPFHELRLDGKRHVVQDNEFFYADADGVTTGNDSLVARRPEGAPFDEKAARALFRVFTNELSGAGSAPSLDDESRAALEALGYVQ
jgi:hypothetical protein